MKRQTKLSTEQQQQHAAEQQQTQAPAVVEFATPEEMLQHDAKQITVPPAIEQRLKQSVGDLPQPKPNWWKRLLGGTKP